MISADERLGRTRNQSTHDGSLADAVRGYVKSLDRVDFGGCPADFVVAFQAHRDAWESSISFLAEFDELRGEMHDLFEVIRKTDLETGLRLERLESAIWSTWADVEEVAEKYRAQRK